jgi:large subunit ribosomal protein L25
MEALNLQAEPRQTTGKQVKQLRRQGFVPAVLYGKDQPPQLLQVHRKPLSKILSNAGTHRLIALQVGSGAPYMTLARDIQRDPVKRDYLHVDFYAVKMNEKVHAQVPLILAGVSLAVKNLGGILTHGLNELEIECLPSDLISAIEVDISALTDLNSIISVADLHLPASITILSDPESMVAKIEPPRVTAEGEEETSLLTSAEPEVLTAAREKEE